MDKKNVGKLMAAMLAATMLLGGCGNQPANNASAGSSAPAESKQEESKQETTPSSEEKAEEVTLRFLGWKTGKEEGAIPDILKAFEEANPGVTVEYEAIPTSNNYQDVLNARLSTGECADVFMASESMLRGFAKNGYVEDLSGVEFVDQFQDNLVKMLTKDNVLTAIPIEEAGLGMIVNMDVLKAAGVNELPQTWPELLDACEKIKTNGQTPFIMGNKTGWSGAIIMNYGITTKYKDYDNDIYFKIQNKETKMSDVYMEFMDKYSELEEKGYTNGKEALGMEFNEGAVAEFAKGESAFLVAGTWMIQEVAQALEGTETVFAPIPMQDEEPLTAQCSLSTALAVNKDAENKDLAIKFIQFWSDDANLKLYVESQNAFSPLQGGTSLSLAEAKPFAEAVAANNMTVGMQVPGEFTVDEWTFITQAAQLLTLGDATTEELGQQIDGEFDKTQLLKAE